MDDVKTVAVCSTSDLVHYMMRRHNPAFEGLDYLRYLPHVCTSRSPSGTTTGQCCAGGHSLDLGKLTSKNCSIEMSWWGNPIPDKKDCSPPGIKSNRFIPLR